jgi:putative Holliday junction resolvase
MIGKRAIAFDIGNKRIGVAVSDPFNEYAMPCETYVRTRNFEADVAAIAKLAQDRGVGVIVCGMPFNYDGTESIQTIKTREFIEHLREKTDLPIELEDERFTTMQARETQIMGGVKLGDRKKTIDSIAASYILESYLNRENGLPNLYIFENCVNLIRELKGYYWGSGDVPKKRDDHCLDEMRYYLTSRPKRLPVEEQKTEIQRDKERLWRRIKRSRKGSE